MAQLKGNPSGVAVDVDSTSKAMLVLQKDAAGNTLPKADRTPSGITPGTTAGLPIVGADRATPRLVRANADGSLAQPEAQVLFFDPVEGAAVNTNLWIQTTTTMAIAQANGVITFNSGSSVANTVGAVHNSQRMMPLPGRSRLFFRSKQRHTAHFNNNSIEGGLLFSAAFSATTALTAQTASGAIWRKTTAGAYVPVLLANGTEVTTGNSLSNASVIAQVAATDYAYYEVDLDETGALFRIVTQAGVVVTGSEQRLDFPSGGSAVGDWSVTHFCAYLRCFNSGGTTGTAVQLLVAETTVLGLDLAHNRPWSHQLASVGYGLHQSPVTTFLQTANYTNITAPTTRTPTNTTAQETTLGGHVSWNNAGTSFAGDDTKDWILFGYQVPSPYALVITGLRISTVNLGAANGATAYTVEYALAVGSSNVSLATAAAAGYRFIPLGVQTLAASAVIGQTFDRDTVWTPGTPIVIQPGRFVSLVGRVLVGTATASQVIRTIAAFDGFFE